MSISTAEHRYVSKDQIERARQIDVLDYVLQYEPDNVKRVGGAYRMKDHPSIEIKSGKWRWYSQSKYGKTALDYLIDVRRYELIDAVCLLLQEQPEGKARSDKVQSHIQAKSVVSKNEPPIKSIPLTIPLRNNNNNRVIAYLLSRGIDKDLILDCISRDDIYESAYQHDLIYKGKDENGKTRYAAIRSTTSGFKGDLLGSSKRYCFLLPPSKVGSNIAAAFESPVDALSHQTMCKHGYIPPFDGWRLSLGGNSILGLAHFLERHPQVTHCLACTDNDDIGDKIAAHITTLPGITVERLLPDNDKKDWNDILRTIQKAERTHNRLQTCVREERG